MSSLYQQNALYGNTAHYSPQINKQVSDLKKEKSKHPCVRKIFILLAITEKKPQHKRDRKLFPLKIHCKFEYSIILRHSGSIKDWLMPEKFMQSDFS